MDCLHYDLGTQPARAVVIVELAGTEANVLLVDDVNYARYRGRQRFRYHGGHVTRSPARIPVPATALWHVVIDMGGFAGQVRASVRVLAA